MPLQLKSQTGFAIVEHEDAQTKPKRLWRLQLKSVNHRFFELKIRMPKSCQPFEMELRTLLQKEIGRGSVELLIEEQTSQNASKVGEVSETFGRLAGALDEIKGVSKFKIPSSVRALILSRYPDLWNSKKLDSTSIEKDLLFSMIAALVEQFQNSRLLEGKQIELHLKTLILTIKNLHSSIKTRLPLIRSEYENQMKSKWNALLEKTPTQQQISEDRVIQEMLLLAEKRDVEEEIERIAAHLEKIESLFQAAGEQQGKRLDFLLQELLREWNTLGSKIQNVSVAHDVVEAKLCVEKLKEQSLNLL